MKISLSTPEKVVFVGETDHVLVRADKGQLNILPHHADLISFVQAGPMSLRTMAGETLNFELGEGVLKVEAETISILCQNIATA